MRPCFAGVYVKAVGFSLYIHIPYCRSKCLYCDFNSYAALTWPEDEYVSALTAELGRRATEPPWAGDTVKTVFFGGGTPSLFRPQSIARPLDAAARFFGIDSRAEITLEANPGTLDRAKLLGVRAAGVNRLSLGAQSFKPAVLRLLGRTHHAGDTVEAVRLAHRAGFERMNLDLIFGVPGQSIEDVRADIAVAVSLGPDHISDYNLTFEEGTPLFNEMRCGRLRPLDADEQADMYAAVRGELASYGFPRYEISNYAPPGHEARHNLAYWRAQGYLGLGAGAYSFARRGAGGCRWWNERDPQRYAARALGEGEAVAGLETIGERTAAAEFVLLNLRLTEGFLLSDFAARFGRTFDELFGQAAAPLLEGGLLVCQRGRLKLSERGVEVADSVSAEFCE